MALVGLGAEAGGDCHCKAESPEMFSFYSLLLQVSRRGSSHVATSVGSICSTLNTKGVHIFYFYSSPR